jgi:hypothetical protein
VSPKQDAAVAQADTLQTMGAARALTPAVIPEYLHNTYWWAYLHPRAVHIFERQWLVNLILWGNFAKLRDAALQEMGDQSSTGAFCRWPVSMVTLPSTWCAD